MTPTQRKAAERLMEQMGNDHRGYDPDFNEAAAILRELLAGTDAENATVEPVQEPGIEYKRGYEEALNDCIRNGLIWARSMFANSAEHIKPANKMHACDDPLCAVCAHGITGAPT